MNRADGYIEEVDEHGNIITDMLFTYDEEERQLNQIRKERESMLFTPEFIPYYLDVVEHYGLTPTEGILYGFIRFFMKRNVNGKNFNFSNDDLATILLVSKNTINNAIVTLKKHGIITTSQRIKAGGGTVRKIYLRVTEIGNIDKPKSVDLVNLNKSFHIKEKFLKEKQQKKEVAVDKLSEQESVTEVTTNTQVQHLTQEQLDESMKVAERMIDFYNQDFPSLPENKRRNKNMYARDIATIMSMHQHSAREIFDAIVYVFQSDFWVSRIKNSTMFVQHYEQIHYQMITQKTKVPL